MMRIINNFPKITRKCYVIPIFCLLNYFIVEVNCALPVITNAFPREMENVLLPNDRQTIDDCQYRFYKYGLREYTEDKCNDLFGGSPYAANAVPAKPLEFPHMAAIGWTSSNGVVEWNCGGSLISEKFILTAAHCTEIDGNPPDLVRLGDIFLNGTLDGMGLAQEYKVKNITRHPNYSFNARYFDIALIELDSNVRLSSAVSAACLWNSEDIYFPRLETAGYGATGFAEEKSGRLLKLSLSPISTAACSATYNKRTRKLESGLTSTHLCAVDPKMDTCPGDSGGPLQINLNVFSRVISFIVGITSFGRLCGVGEPGVYTRVSPFVNWIESVVNVSYDPINCSIVNYLHKQTDSLPWYSADAPNIVSFVWNGGNASKECRGSLIDYNYVISSAQCTMDAGSEPTHVDINKQRIEIARIIRHPEYRSDLLYHDIALTELDRYLVTSRNIVPICLWKKKSLPDEQVILTGTRRSSSDWIPSTHLVTLTDKNLKNVLNCPTKPLSMPSKLPYGVTDDQLEVCASETDFLVPNTCKLDRMGRDIQNGNRTYQYMYATNSEGESCGYGRTGILTKISSYYDWIESVILNKTGIVFSDDELYEGDSCSLKNGDAGTCVPDENCKMLIQNSRSMEGTNQYCRFDKKPIVCCPSNYINGFEVKNQKQSGRKIDECSAYYGNFERVKLIENNCTGKSYVQYKHIARILWNKENRTCFGSLISKQHVITSATCGKDNPDLLVLGLFDTVYEDYEVTSKTAEKYQQRIQISEVRNHPDHDAILNNIALITLATPAIINEFVAPACLWQSKTHTPFKLHSTSNFGNDTKVYQNIKLATHNDVCNNYRMFPKGFNSEIMCVDNDDPNTRFCESRGSSLHSVVQQNDRSVPYVVGVLNFLNCEQISFSMYTRVSYHLDWINAAIGN